VTLCDPCSRQWLRWLDYRSRSRWIVNIGGGANGAERNTEARAANADATYRLIRRQQAGIVAACKHVDGAA
jgi:hypothetical protein